MRVSRALALLAIVLAVAQHVRSQQKILEPRDPVLASEEKAIQQGRPADAQKILSDAISQAKKEDANSPRLAEYLERLAGLVNAKANSDESLALYRRALDINQKAFGPEDKTVVNDLVQIGTELNGQRKPDEAERALKQALDIAELNPDIPVTSKIWPALYLAQIYVREQRFDEAEKLLLDAQRSCAQLTDPRYVSLCDLSFDFVGLYRAQGRVAEAQRADSANELRFYNAPEVVNLNSQARQYQQKHDYEQATKNYQSGVTWIEENKPPNSQSSLPFEYGQLGWALQEAHRYQDAEKAFLKEFNLEEENAEQPGPNGGFRDPAGRTHFDDFRFDDLVGLYREWNRLSEAEPVIQHVLERQEKFLGPNDPSLARTLVALADLYQEEGGSDKTKYAQAQPLYERALSIRQQALGPDDELLADILSPYADLLGKMHEDAKAVRVQARIRALGNL